MDRKTALLLGVGGAAVLAAAYVTWRHLAPRSGADEVGEADKAAAPSPSTAGPPRQSHDEDPTPAPAASRADRRHAKLPTLPALTDAAEDPARHGLSTPVHVDHALTSDDVAPAVKASALRLLLAHSAHAPLVESYVGLSTVRRVATSLPSLPRRSQALALRVLANLVTSRECSAAIYSSTDLHGTIRHLLVVHASAQLPQLVSCCSRWYRW